MLSLIIVKDHCEIQVERISSPIVKIGSGPENDILLKDLSGKGLILTIDDGRAVLSEVSKGDYKTKTGPWGKAIKQDSIYFLEGHRLFLTFASVLKESPSGNFNINLDKLPKDPTKRSYASDLLDFSPKVSALMKPQCFFIKETVSKCWPLKNSQSKITENFS